MVAVASSIALPKELIQEIEAAAEETGLTKEVLLRAAVRQYVRANRRWRETGKEGARILAAHRVRPEDVEAFVEDFMDAMEEDA